MYRQSSYNQRNKRNQRNPKHKFKGEYIVWIEKEDNRSYSVYSTNSIFWRDFFLKEAD